MLPLYNPGKMNLPAFAPLKDCSLSSSWVADKCGGCAGDERGHSLEACQVIMVGDHFLPPVVGGQGECVPVGRVDSATFEHIKVFLGAQKESGFSMQPNSIILLSLTHYACVVGGDTYWNEFDAFCKWATREFRATTVPFFVPFPSGLSQTYLSRLHHAMTAARARYMGDFKGGVDWCYTL